MNNSNAKDNSLPRSRIFFIIWTVIFGVTLGLGGSVLEPFSIPGMGVTAASFLVALMVTLNKLILLRPYSVTAMYAVVGLVSIFTTYLGPPSILKPLFVLAGLSFDAGTFFRTKNIRYWNIAVGHVIITITGFFFFWLNVAVMAPGSAKAVGAVLVAASPFHLGISLIIAYGVYEFIPPSDPPEMVQEVRSQVS